MNTGKKYQTKQQQSIVACMKESRENYIQIRKLLEKLELKQIHIGVATAYRSLNKLVEAGMVRKIYVDGMAGACYQYISDEQTEGYCLKCEKCNHIINTECNHILGLYDHILEDHDFIINPDKTIFYGVCENCMSQKK